MSLDAFAGGFVVQNIMAFWFHLKFGVDESMLGLIFFGANILAGVSALLAGRLAAKFGLINTLVPSNFLLFLVPLMPNLPLAIGLLMLRFSVPTRQSYTMTIVAPDQRSAASGVTTIARSIGAAISPVLSSLLLASPGLISAPFLVAGGVKIVYDLMLYRAFKSLKPHEKQL